MTVVIKAAVSFTESTTGIFLGNWQSFPDTFCTLAISFSIRTLLAERLPGNALHPFSLIFKFAKLICVFFRLPGKLLIEVCIFFFDPVK